ncbi:hypothetical protein Ancab_005606 [Ancistrocladus abbreviatus]
MEKKKGKRERREVKIAAAANVVTRITSPYFSKEKTPLISNQRRRRRIIGGRRKARIRENDEFDDQFTLSQRVSPYFKEEAACVDPKIKNEHQQRQSRKDTVTSGIKKITRRCCGKEKGKCSFLQERIHTQISRHPQEEAVDGDTEYEHDKNQKDNMNMEMHKEKRKNDYCCCEAQNDEYEALSMQRTLSKIEVACGDKHCFKDKDEKAKFRNKRENNKQSDEMRKDATKALHIEPHKGLTLNLQTREATVQDSFIDEYGKKEKQQQKVKKHRKNKKNRSDGQDVEEEDENKYLYSESQVVVSPYFLTKVNHMRNHEDAQKKKEDVIVPKSSCFTEEESLISLEHQDLTTAEVYGVGIHEDSHGGTGIAKISYDEGMEPQLAFSPHSRNMKRKRVKSESLAQLEIGNTLDDETWDSGGEMHETQIRCINVKGKKKNKSAKKAYSKHSDCQVSKKNKDGLEDACRTKNGKSDCTRDSEWPRALSSKKVSPYFQKALKEGGHYEEEDEDVAEFNFHEAKKSNRSKHTQFEEILSNFAYKGGSKMSSQMDSMNQIEGDAKVNGSGQRGKTVKHRRGISSRGLSVREKKADAYRRKTSDNMWRPPRSPFNLLQEDHVDDPWRVLVICMLLNMTTGSQVCFPSL